MTLVKVWFGAIVANFRSEFEQKFSTKIITSDPEQINFIIHHQFFSSLWILIGLLVLVGALYHALLNSSKYEGTLGKIWLHIKIVKTDGSRLTLTQAFLHYCLSILPIVLMIYLVGDYSVKQIEFDKLITDSLFNFVAVAIILLWVQVQLFTKRKTTAYDLILGTVLIVSPRETSTNS